MTPEQAAKLLESFPAEAIGKLPRVTCKACSDGRCDKHQRQKCSTCNAYVSSQHIHLDYVGHADVTHRLLTVDPDWTWEPAAVDERGLPLFDLDSRGNPVGLWIHLTVAGVTRPGYGSCPGNQNDAVKVLIGDALRNAALRFGVAWELWAKGDRSDPAAENTTSSPATAQRRTRKQRQDQPSDDTQPQSEDDIVKATKLALVKAAKDIGMGQIPQINADFAEWSQGDELAKADVATLRQYTEHLRSRAEAPHDAS